MESWCLPPKEDAEFVANMEDVLDTYERVMGDDEVLVCMDEQPYQLLEHTREPLAAQPGSRAKEDYEYKRDGTCSIFMMVAPDEGIRLVHVRPHRTAVDWAQEMRWLADEVFPDKKIVLVQDNLNTHVRGSFYKAFPPEEARRLVQRFEFHYTPKHGSWLNIAECELSAMTKQCLSRRLENIERVHEEVAAWEKDRNLKLKKVNWRFTTKDARIKMISVYPTWIAA